MPPDALARRFWPRLEPERRGELERELEALRAAHPEEPEAMIAARLARRLPMQPHGRLAGAHDPPSVLRVERRLAAHAALHEAAPGELLDGIPVRWAREPVTPEAIADVWRRWLAARRAERLFAYVHVPFCRTKCGFCQFESVIGAGADAVEQTLAATVAEAERLEGALGSLEVDAMTVGGGTPSELSAEQLDRLLGAIVGRLIEVPSGAYFSAELNPDSTTEAKLEVLRARGVNRVSFGVQSLHEPTLRAIARGYQSPAMVDEAIEAARQVGGLKIAADLIASLPEESGASFEEGARRLVARRPDQIVLYEYQPVTRRGRAMPAGPLALDEAARRFLAVAVGAGYRVVPHTGSSVIVELPGARRFDTRYVQHAREPTSLLGLGPFAESHAFGVASYVAGPDPAADRPYRALARTPREELGTYLGRRLAAGLPLEDDALARFFGGSLTELAPEAVGWLLEEGSLVRTDTGYRGSPAREEAIRAAWAFLDARTLGRLRQRLSGGVPLERARSGLGEGAAALLERARPLLDVALAADPLRRRGAERDEAGLRLALAPDELDPTTCEAWLGEIGEHRAALSALGGHGLLESVEVQVWASGTEAEAGLAAPAPALLECLASALSVPDEGWWRRAAALRIDARGVWLGWRVDPTASRLWAASRRALPDALARALERGSMRYERGPGEASRLRVGVLDDEALRVSLPEGLRDARGRISSLLLPLRGARPLLEGLEAELTLRPRSLPTTRE